MRYKLRRNGGQRVTWIGCCIIFRYSNVYESFSRSWLILTDDLCVTTNTTHDSLRSAKEFVESSELEWGVAVHKSQFVFVIYNFGLLLGFMISAMQRMHWMQWMADFWMEGSFASKWHDMGDRRLRTVDTAGGGG